VTLTRGSSSALCKTLLTVALLFFGTGCLEIDTKIVLHPDGSGTITERVNFSRRLLDVAGAAEPELRLESLLTREAALARMKHMGNGITLATHAVRDADGASREAEAVFKIRQLKDFVYVSPFVPHRPRHDRPRQTPDRLFGLKTVIRPVLQDSSSLKFRSGNVRVDFQPFGLSSSPKDKKPTMPSRSPLVSQTYRELRPIFEDLMSDLKIKVVFESYAPIVTSLSGRRDAAAGTHRVDLVDFAPGRNMDAQGYPFLENEEIMVDLLRWDPNSPWVMNTVREWTRNKTLPVLHYGGGIFFRPSAHYFDKWFKGQTLKYYRGGKLQSKPAKFEEIGWKPKKGGNGT